MARKKVENKCPAMKTSSCQINEKRQQQQQQKRDGPLSALIFRHERNQLAEKEELDPLFLFDSPVLLETLVVGRRWQRKRCRRHPLLRIVIIHAFQLCVYNIYLSGAASRETLLLLLLLHSWGTHPPFLINSWLCCLEYFMYIYIQLVRVMNVNC